MMWPMPVHSRTANVGKAAPDFELPDASGQLHRLTDLRADGPVVLVFLRGFM
jgi:peroxiredoxin